MAKSKASKRKWRPEIVVAIIGLIGVLSAAVITNFDKWLYKPANSSNSVAANTNSSKVDPTVSPPSMLSSGDKVSISNQSISELIKVLEIRADQILKAMDDDKHRLLRRIHSKERSSGLNVEYTALLLSEFDSSQKLFTQLHEKHIEALKAGQLVAAHEIFLDIRNLLWLRSERLIQLGIFKREEVKGRYGKGPSYSERLTSISPNDYPGASLDNIMKEHPEITAVLWGVKEECRDFTYQCVDKNRMERLTGLLDVVK